eukprot:55701_1
MSTYMQLLQLLQQQQQQQQLLNAASHNPLIAQQQQLLNPANARLHNPLIAQQQQLFNTANARLTASHNPLIAQQQQLLNTANARLTASHNPLIAQQQQLLNTANARLTATHGHNPLIAQQQQLLNAANTPLSTMLYPQIVNNNAMNPQLSNLLNMSMAIPSTLSHLQNMNTTIPSTNNATIPSTNNALNATGETIEKRISLNETKGLFIQARIKNESCQFNIQYLDDLCNFKTVEIPYIVTNCRHLVQDWIQNDDFSGIQMGLNEQRMDLLHIPNIDALRSRFIGMMRRLNVQILEIISIRAAQDKLTRKQEELEAQQRRFDAEKKSFHAKVNLKKRKRYEMETDDYSSEHDEPALSDTVESDDDDDVLLDDAKKELKKLILLKRNKHKPMTVAIFRSHCKDKNKTKLLKYYKAVVETWTEGNSADPSFYFTRKGGGYQLIWTGTPRKPYKKRRKTTTPSPSQPRPKNALQILKEDAMRCAIEDNESNIKPESNVIDSESAQQKDKESAFPMKQPTDLDHLTNSNDADILMKDKQQTEVKEQMDISIADVNPENDCNHVKQCVIKKSESMADTNETESAHESIVKVKDTSE